MNELHFLIGNRMMIRRLKKVLSQLPSKRRQKIIISTDTQITKKIKKILQNVKDWNLNIEERHEREKKREEDVGKRLANNYEYEKL